MKILLTILFLIGSSTFLSTELACINVAGDESPDNMPRMTLVKGKVVITNHPTLGKTAGNGIQILFQNLGCEKCTVGTDSNLKGEYSIGLADGKYRLIVMNPSPPVEDLLDKDQERILVVDGTSRQLINFDIDLTLP